MTTTAPVAVATHNPKNAVALIRLIEPVVAELGYHCALTGSVLFKGGSEKDTDIILYPHDPKEKRDALELMRALKPLGITARYETDARYVNRRVWLGGYEGRRIDFFFL